MGHMKTDCDVLIVGAGASGLACAAELDSSSLRYMILEARSRIGGRVFTFQPENDEAAQELGAEFIHGSAKQTLQWMQKLQLSFYDACDEHLFMQSEKLTDVPKFFEHLDQLMPPPSALHKKDHTVKEYLEKKKGPALWKKMFASFVEGFHAADLEKIGVHGLLSAQEADEEGMNGVSMFRHVRGYDQLMKGIYQSLRQREVLRLHTQVRKIQWQRGSVKVQVQSRVTGKIESISARRIVVTVPIGVLQAQAKPHSRIVWDPLPANLESALRGIEMGHTQRMIFQFRSRFWENVSEGKPVSFLHAGPEEYFPTWWSLAPLRQGQLVAWQGGPRALAMSQWPLKQKVQTALETLSRLTGRSVSFLEKELQTCRTHDWSLDPFSLGAYSYIKKDGYELAKKLSQSAQDTVYFAGEATCLDATRGTVEGALASGSRVGKTILRTLDKGKIDSNSRKAKSHSAASVHSSAMN